MSDEGFPTDVGHPVTRSLKVVKGSLGAPTATTRSGPPRRGGKPQIPPWKVGEIKALLADLSLSRNEIARRSGVSQATVTKLAAEVGRSFDRTASAAAAAARVEDGRAVRRELADLCALHARDTEKRREELAGKDARAHADLSRSVGTLARAVADLDRLDLERARAEREANGGAEIDTWLDGMGAG